MRWDTLFRELGQVFDDQAAWGSPPGTLARGNPAQHTLADRDLVTTLVRLRQGGKPVALELRNGRQVVIRVRSVGLDWLGGISVAAARTQLIVPLHALACLLVPHNLPAGPLPALAKVTLAEALRVWAKNAPFLTVTTAAQEYSGVLLGAGLDYVDVLAPRSETRGGVRRISFSTIELMGVLDGDER